MALLARDTPPADPDGAVAARPRRRLLWMTVFGGALALWIVLVGLPSDYAVAFGWLWLATIAWNNDRPWGQHWRFARDWLPVLAVLVVYDFSRGAADELLDVHIDPLIDADRAMFGVVPTVWLQQHLYTPGDVHWWDVGVALVYFSHFVVSLTVAVVLWLRSRAVWAAFMLRWISLTALGLVTYVLYPAAPPWFAAAYGHLGATVHRPPLESWRELGLHLTGKLLDAGQALANPVAAMPSLHAAFALLVVCFVGARVRRRWLPVLLLYPLAMAFTLVYGGEHYVVDVLVGWAYVLVILAVVGAAERWARSRPPAPVGAGETPVGDGMLRPGG
jgi:membrane-associated phospholipid phosphatase